MRAVLFEVGVGQSLSGGVRPGTILAEATSIDALQVSIVSDKVASGRKGKKENRGCSIM